MNRRTCTCGATIICADLDGYTIWVDDQHVPGGIISLERHGDTLDAVVDGRGSYQRHTCHADPQPTWTETPAPRTTGQVDTLQAMNEERTAQAAARSAAAARAVLAAGQPLSALEQRVAQLRTQHPHVTLRRLAAIGGLRHASCSSALYRIEQLAERLTTGAPR